MIELLLGRNPELRLIPARDCRFLHLPPPSSFLRFSRSAPRRQRRRSRGRTIHLIKCETRDGFHASFGRGDPAPSDKKSRNVEDDISLSGSWGDCGQKIRSPFPLWEGVRG